MNRRTVLLSLGALALGAARRSSAQPATRIFRVAYLLLATGRNTVLVRADRVIE